MNQHKYTEDEIKKITESVSVLDYFQYLAKQGKLDFDRKSGSDFYFKTDNNKYSVSERGFYDFKTGEGGQIIKAVMSIENKSWKEAIDFLKDFSKTYIPEDIAEIKRIKKNTSQEETSNTSITKITPPNNDKLIQYFENRGIDKEILQEFTKQVHYEVGNKKYFGIGLENQSQGYEIRNPIMKTKLGKNDIAIINKNNSNNVFVFEGMTDMLSFLQLQKLNNKENNSTIVVLNSVTNVNKFIENFKDFKGKINLLLDGDNAGNEATQNIVSSLPNNNVRDLRYKYGIGVANTGINDLNDYLQNRSNIQKKSIKLAEGFKVVQKSEITEQKITQNEQYSSEPTRIPSPITVGGEPSEPNIGNINSTSQSEQEKDNSSRQGMDSYNAGNGFGTSEQLSWGGQRLQSVGGNGRTQSQSNRTQSPIQGGERKGIGQDLAEYNRPRNRENSLGDVNAISRTSILELTQKLKEQKNNNELITELVNALTIVAEDKIIHLNPNVEITEDIQSLVSQYKSGGIAKEGRGILDEYYTDERLVQTVGNLIKDNFPQGKKINVLEPSVGVGNFLSAINNLSVYTDKVSTFEINETTAKITKILNPNVEVNLRSFETEFISDDGQKKAFVPKYDLVIGNPPYGQHRGFYKGLGEESNISRFEDYFVKRSLDVLKEGGTLAMVLPSGWLNRQNKLSKAELSEAYRLPNGIFKATDVGTDIIILKKNSNAEIKDISNYFEENPNKILGYLSQKTNRFGKLENYVKGSLEEALIIIEEQKQEQKQEQKENKQKNLFDFDFSTNEKKEISIDEKEVNLDIIEKLKSKIKSTLDNLQNIKFKSPIIVNEFEKYNNVYRDLENNPESFTNERFEEINKNLERLNNQIVKQKNTEYNLQTYPEIKKGILKYQFEKQDKVVETGLQNSPNLTQEQLFAFQQTDYDGRISVHESRLMKYANVYDGALYHDFYYTEGDIYEKLEQLEKDFSKKIDWLDDKEHQKQYNKQKALLESVLPKKKELNDIIISPNHEFVHNFILGQKEKEIQVYDGINPFTGKTKYISKKELADYSLAEQFQDFVRNLPSEALGKSSSWEVNAFVRNETVTGSDRERNALIRERRKEVANDLFKKFLHEVLSDDLKERFVNEFNRKYNNIHIPDYSQFPLFSKIHQNFKGKPLQLTEVQKAGIGRLTTKGVGLLAHEVGFGKTLSGILSMHEAMERGNATRPLIVVPNDNILKQWVETIFETIPNAKVNVLGNLGKDYDLSKFDNKDGEITLVTYEGFNNIGFSPETTQRLANKFSYISENELKTLKHSERDRQIEMQKKEELQGKMKKGKVYDWEDFGFDHLTFDEVHNANHIVGKVKIEDRRFASDFRNQQQRTSQLGINTWMASQYLQDKYDGRNVTLLSATPFTNKPLEYYSILSLIANERLEKSGYFNVNNFFETFMEADTEMEIDAKGDIKNKTNVRRFKNNDLFQKLLSEYIDIKGEEDNPELKRPNRINKEYKIEQNDLTKEQYEHLNSSLDESKEGAILTHILNARKIAFSPYLSNDYTGKIPSNKEFIENSPKLKTTMDLIAQNKKDKPEAGQIIYSELGVSEFPKLKDYLVNEVGYISEEVAIITGATTKNQRLDIQEKFNAGNIKIVIGSEAIQEGMNLQQNTTDMYLLTLPYNFTSLRQTEGRAWRQGNKWENVRINFMLTNDSIDVFMLQKLQTKQSRYMEAMKNGANVIDVSDVDTQELKTAIITDPYTRADIEVELLKKKYEAEKNRHNADLGFISRKFEKFVNSDEYKRVIEIQKNIKNYSEWQKGSDYYKNQLIKEKEYLVIAEQKLKVLVDDLIKKGINISEFEQQRQKTKIKIEELDKKIIEELPLIKENLIAQYKQEKEKQLKNNSQVDFVKERAEENKSFFKIKQENTKSEIIENKQIEEHNQYKGRKL